MNNLAIKEIKQIKKRYKKTLTDDQKFLRENYFYVLLPKLIPSEKQYDTYIKIHGNLLQVYHDLDKKAKKEALDYLNILGHYIKEYEDKHYPVPKVKPNEYLKHLIELKELKHKDLIGPVFNSESAVSRAISGTRKISIEQAKKLGQYFNIDFKVFL